MARLFDGIDDFLTTASNLDNSGTNVMSISCWVWWDTVSGNFDMIMECTDNIFLHTTGFYCSPNNPTGGGNFDLTLVGNVGPNNLLVPGNISTGQFVHLAFIPDKNGVGCEWVLYVNGALSGAPCAGSNNTNNFGNDPWFIFSRAGASLFGAGRIAELAIYPVRLTADEVLTLSKGISPQLVRPQSLSFYWRLFGEQSPEPAITNAPNLTVSGAVQTPHPRFYCAE